MNWKNKKVLGMPIAIFLIGVMVVGLGAAAIVDFLSNQVTANVNVESPLEIKIWDGNDLEESISLGSTYGGNTVAFDFREENRADVDIDSDLTIIVGQSNETNVCSEITMLRFKGMQANNWNYVDMNTCDDDTGYLKFVIPTIVPANTAKDYNVEVTFNQYALGEYEAKIQHI